MEQTRKHWWDLRNEDLLALAEKEAPLYVYNEETLNEIFFDLSAMDVLSGLFYPFHLNFNPRILQKVIDQDIHFRCYSLGEVNHLREHFPKLPPERILFLSDPEHGKDCETALHQGLHVAVRTDNHTILVLSNDADGESRAPMSGMDIPEIENHLETIQNAFPQFELHLELPLHLVSYAGALLVEALEGGTTEGIHYIRTRLPMNNALYGEIHGAGHQVINLSSPQDEKTIMTRIIPEHKHAGNGIFYLKTLCPVERGDMLLLTHMGTYGPETRVNDEGRNGLSEWYLKARSLCRVRL